MAGKIANINIDLSLKISIKFSIKLSLLKTITTNLIMFTKNSIQQHSFVLRDWATLIDSLIYEATSIAASLLLFIDSLSSISLPHSVSGPCWNKAAGVL